MSDTAIRVPPEFFKRWDKVLATMPGQTELGRLSNLLVAAEIFMSEQVRGTPDTPEYVRAIDAGIARLELELERLRACRAANVEKQA